MQESIEKRLNSCIRQYRHDDASRVRALIRSVLEEFGFTLDCAGDDSDIVDINQSYASPSSTFLILEAGGEFAGTVGVKRCSQDEAELRRMYLKPELRGIGLGKELLVSALEFSAVQGYGTVILRTSEMFSRAIRLYERFGFRRTGMCNERCELLYKKILKKNSH
jgi:GNAT superfamily N-acetyltransferase